MINLFIIASSDDIRLFDTSKLQESVRMERNIDLDDDKIIIKDNCSKKVTLKKDSDPGAARLGNFINYYQFNPPFERLSHLFPEKLLDKLEHCIDDEFFVCLDVGCNSGVSKNYYLIDK